MLEHLFCWTRPAALGSPAPLGVGANHIRKAAWHGLYADAMSHAHVSRVFRAGNSTVYLCVVSRGSSCGLVMRLCTEHAERRRAAGLPLTRTKRAGSEGADDQHCSRLTCSAAGCLGSAATCFALPCFPSPSVMGAAGLSLAFGYGGIPVRWGGDEGDGALKGRKEVRQRELAQAGPTDQRR